MSNKIVWLSFDPVAKKIDYYPTNKAVKLEEEFSNCMSRRNRDYNSVFLGSDFYNATVCFNNYSNMYQTTPGVYMARGGGKQPGFRTVKRVIIDENENEDESKITLHIKNVNGEWRISNLPDRHTTTFSEVVSSRYIMSSSNDHYESYIYWKPEDLDHDDKFVVVWQWCREQKK